MQFKREPVGFDRIVFFFFVLLLVSSRFIHFPPVSVFVYVNSTRFRDFDQPKIGLVEKAASDCVRALCAFGRAIAAN